MKLGFAYSGVWGIIVLALDIWAIVNILQSKVDTGKKVLWTLLVLLLPVIGFIFWALMGPRSSKR